MFASPFLYLRLRYFAKEEVTEMNRESSHFLRYLESLKDSLIFGSLPVSDLRWMLGSMKPEKWPEGTFKNSSEVSFSLHFIVMGKVKAFQINPNTGREHTIFILTAGSLFDIIYFLDRRPHDVYWEVLEDLELLTYPMEDMRHWLLDYPVLNNTILRYLGIKMRQFEDITADISLHNTLVRLAHLLLKHINEESRKLEVIDNLSNDEIASLIGTTRAVVNRHIQVLKKCGAISVKRKHIDIENIEVLLSIYEEKLVP